MSNDVFDDDDLEAAEMLGDLVFENSVLKATIAALLNCFNRNDEADRWFISPGAGNDLTRAFDGVFKNRMGYEFWSDYHKARDAVRRSQLPLKGGLE